MLLVLYLILDMLISEEQGTVNFTEVCLQRI